MPDGGFQGLRVLSFETRRGREIGQLIAGNGGKPMVVPSLREAPIESNPDVATFAQELLAGRLDAAIFLTGVGTRALLQAAAQLFPADQLRAALGRLPVLARSQKPAAALREMDIPITLTAPEPNTWREILQILDERPDLLPLPGRRVAVQEYGASSQELTAGLEARGARLLPVRVYQWAPPQDLAPLKNAVHALIEREIDVVLFTASVQLVHLLRLAEEMNLRRQLLAAFAGVLVCSIGPVTSEQLRSQHINVDLEPSHPKMGFLVKEAADRSADLLRRKRAAAATPQPGPI